MNLKILYKKIMSDQLMIYLFLIAWSLQIIIGKQLTIFYNVLIILLVLAAYIVGLRTERLFPIKNKGDKWIEI